jgi:hypothetical protein
VLANELRKPVTSYVTKVTFMQLRKITKGARYTRMQYRDEVRMRPNRRVSKFRVNIRDVAL